MKTISTAAGGSSERYSSADVRAAELTSAIASLSRCPSAITSRLCWNALSAELVAGPNIRVGVTSERHAAGDAIGKATDGNRVILGSIPAHDDVEVLIGEESRAFMAGGHQHRRLEVERWQRAAIGVADAKAHPFR